MCAYIYIYIPPLTRNATLTLTLSNTLSACRADSKCYTHPAGVNPSG